MRVWQAALVVCLVSACKRDKSPPGPSDPGLMSAAAFCRLILEAPKRHLASRCSPEEKKLAGYERLVAMASRPVAACVAALEPGVTAGRLKLHREPAEACARAIEGASWRSSLRTRELAAYAECKGLTTGAQGEGASCRTSLDCAADLWCAGASFPSDGTCRKRGSAGAGCEAPLLFLFDETRASCGAGHACDFGSFRPAYARGYPPPLSPALERELAARRTTLAEAPLDTSRSQALKDAADFGMIGLLNAGGEAHDGGGGIGLGRPRGSRFGAGSSRRSAVPAPRVRMGATTVNGRLPPEVIQRIVRQSFGRFRLCYENGLETNPKLQGRVSAKFVIGRDGNVSNVQGSGDLPDSGVVQCVLRAFYGLSFPQPEGGIVTVSYPILFTPGGADVPAAAPSAPTPDAAVEPPAEPASEVADKPVNAPLVCVAEKTRGQACAAPHHCGSGLTCRAGRCEAPGARGEACEADMECGADFYCGVAGEPAGARGICKPLEPGGTACDDTSQCRGACGPDGKCIALCGAG